MVAVTDFMPLRGVAPDIVRIVEGKRAGCAMRMELVIRFDYGSIVPWVRRTADGIRAIAGPDSSGSARRSSTTARTSKRSPSLSSSRASGCRSP